ncbi:hypothetical protein [Micromonospora endolithica]|uniref:Uncharacterized protein n=1 Tax=Micromonospora endolithica TaxID=230091 RepID=A0A3A9ZIE5_9ACTN|nr:hypothetical protein [Micromonospora endolithica]RKN48201.1 hypothetical protein D7223_09170 [Micromonospora endolithica]TWJ24763.1 hypothetical protein JD76_04919 [Micromonospora endolithica]
MTIEDRHRALQEALQKKADELARILDKAGAEARTADGRTREPLAEVEKGIQEARQLADAVTRDGGEAAADLATEKLVVAINQLAAVLEAVGGKLDHKRVDLDYRHSAGAVQERVEGTGENGATYVASPTFAEDARHFFPGGAVGGRLIPRGWYSIPWWRDVKPGTVANAAGTGLVFGEVAHEFYEHVLAQLPGQPSHETWAKGVSAGYRVSADWWPFDGDSVLDLLF